MEKMILYQKQVLNVRFKDLWSQKYIIVTKTVNVKRVMPIKREEDKNLCFLK